MYPTITATNNIPLFHTCWSPWLRPWIETIFPRTNTSNFSIIQTPCISKLISASVSTELLPTGLLYFGSSKWPWKIWVSYCRGKKDLDFFFLFPLKKIFTNVAVCWIGPVWFSMVIIQNKSEVPWFPTRLQTCWQPSMAHHLSFKIDFWTLLEPLPPLFLLSCSGCFLKAEYILDLFWRKIAFLNFCLNNSSLIFFPNNFCQGSSSFLSACFRSW